MNSVEQAHATQTAKYWQEEIRAAETLDSVEGNTDSNWLRAAETAVNWLAKSRLNGFTTDDVWQRLDDMGMTGQVHDNRALGPVMLRQARAGVIVTGH
jgi:hypothetical protein